MVVILRLQGSLTGSMDYVPGDTTPQQPMVDKGVLSVDQTSFALLIVVVMYRIELLTNEQDMPPVLVNNLHCSRCHTAGGVKSAK